MLRTQRFLSATAVTFTLAAFLTTVAATMPSGDAASNEPKVLYLTFDDGPGDETVDILNVLGEHDAKAVFFGLGKNVARDSDLGRRIVAEGHSLANHTWDHLDLTGINASGRAQQLDRTTELLDQLGSDSRCVRPPYGATDAGVEHDLADRDLREVLWNVDTEDWTHPGADAIADKLLRAESGDVVLMHDGGGDRRQTVEAMREALPELTDDGYSFEIVPGC